MQRGARAGIWLDHVEFHEVLLGYSRARRLSMSTEQIRGQWSLRSLGLWIDRPVCVLAEV